MKGFQNSRRVQESRDDGVHYMFTIQLGWPCMSVCICLYGWLMDLMEYGSWVIQCRLVLLQESCGFPCRPHGLTLSGRCCPLGAAKPLQPTSLGTLGCAGPCLYSMETVTSCPGVLTLMRCKLQTRYERALTSSNFSWTCGAAR